MGNPVTSHFNAETLCQQQTELSAPLISCKRMWIRPFRQYTKILFCACATTPQSSSTTRSYIEVYVLYKCVLAPYFFDSLEKHENTWNSFVSGSHFVLSVICHYDSSLILLIIFLHQVDVGRLATEGFSPELNYPIKFFLTTVPKLESRGILIFLSVSLLLSLKVVVGWYVLISNK